jgi:hypothetical protein
MKYKNLVLWDMLHTDIVRSSSERAFLADDVFTLLQITYQNVLGGLHFSSADELVVNTSVWKIIYFQTTIVGVVIYKAKKGLKMVALALCHKLNKPLKQHTKTMLSYLFKVTFNNTWMEVSEAAERFIVDNGGEKYFISNTLATQLTGKEIVALCSDGYHYQRVVKGVLKTKVMVGHAKF